jgi:hypothetical protein
MLGTGDVYRCSRSGVIEGTAEAAAQGECFALGPPVWNASEALACAAIDTIPIF